MFYNISTAILGISQKSKLIQVKPSLYKLMDLDHFAIEEKLQFWKWKNICWLISFEILTDGLDMVVYYFLYIQLSQNDINRKI